MLLDLLFLIPLFIIGSICTFTDIKYGKIRNKWIKIGLTWTALIYLYLIFLNVSNFNQEKNLYYILEMLVNGLIAFGVGYSLWQFKLWSAGDAKLFMVFAFLTPLKFYSDYYMDYFPSFVLLLNTFFLIILFLAIESLFFISKSKIELILQRKNIKKSDQKKHFKFKLLNLKVIKTVETYLNYLAFYIILRIGMQAISRTFTQGIGSNSVLFLLALFAVRKYLLRSIMKKKKVMIAIGVMTGGYIIHLILSNQEALLFSTLRTALIFMVTIGLLMRFLSQYIEKKEVKSIKIKELKTNIVILQSELEKISEKFGKEKFKNKFGSNYPDGLRKEQIKFLQNLFIKEPEAKIKIYKTFSFSPFILAALIATIITKGSLLSIVLKFFR